MHAKRANKTQGVYASPAFCRCPASTLPGLCSIRPSSTFASPRILSMNPAFFAFVAGDAVLEGESGAALEWRDSVGRDSSSALSEWEVGVVGAGCRSAGW